MTNRVKLDAYDWSQISQRAAERARADKQSCSILEESAKTYAGNAQQSLASTQTIANSFDSNVTVKTGEFDANASAKTTAYDSNHSAKVQTYDNNHTAKMQAYDSNDTAKLAAYNSNTVTKTSEYDNNHSTKIAELNTLKNSITAMIPTVVTYD